MKKLILTVTSLILTLSLAVTAFAFSIIPDYSDVPETHWAYSEISKLTQAGLFKGKGNEAYETFDPDGNVRGSEIYETLYRLDGCPTDYELNFDFDKEIYYDDTTHSPKYFWFKDSLVWATNEGIALAYTIVSSNTGADASFIAIVRYGSEYFPPSIIEDWNSSARWSINPDAHFEFAKRADIVAMLYNYITTHLGITDLESGDISSFPDADECTINTRTRLSFPQEQVAAWEWAVDAGIIIGFDDGLLRPQKTLSRAEYAMMLDRFIDYLETLK